MSYQRVREAEANLERERQVYLSARGWTRTFDASTARWLWEKHFPDGATLLVGTYTALDIELQDGD